MNNSTDAEMENQYRTERADDAKKIRKVLGFSINNLNLLDMELLQEAKKCIVEMVQLKYFNEELKQLKMKNKENVKISSKISSLNPYLEENGIIRVGGRLEKSDINKDSKHPILIQRVVISQN